MPYASNPVDNVRIHYETHGNGTPLLLHHGGGGSLERWHELGYVRVLSHHFRLILVDARGHGLSDHPHHAGAYSYERFVSDLVTVLDNAGIERAHFFGYSLGALVGFRIPCYASIRFMSLTLGGAHPYGNMEFFDRQYKMFRNGLAEYVQKRESEMQPVAQAELDRLRAADLRVYAAVGEGLSNEPSAMECLQSGEIPTLLFAGEGDQTDGTCTKLPAAADAIPNSVLLMVPELDHQSLLTRTDLIVPCLLSFLGSVVHSSVTGEESPQQAIPAHD